jgi:hypothetical protein
MLDSCALEWSADWEVTMDDETVELALAPQGISVAEF